MSESEETAVACTTTTPEYINLRVLGQDNSSVFFKMKTGSPLKKLMDAYCKRIGQEVGTVRFLFDGKALHENDTPLIHAMKHNNTIEIYLLQTGGAFGY